MDQFEISRLLRPFLSDNPSDTLSESQLHQLSTYLDLLLRWNSRINLTSVRQPEAIVTRHFGESIFTARHLFVATAPQSEPTSLVDVGSGAGLPGLPIKIWAPATHLILIESNQKKATFLREVIRATQLHSAEVFAGRAEDFRDRANVVTLRAVEHFGCSLGIAAQIAVPTGRLALLVGAAQVPQACELAPKFTWQDPLPIPLSSSRVLLVGTKGEESS